MSNRIYTAIDLKSYYASVECVERGLDPMTTNLVVADVSRTEKTICLAVSPSLKAYGISGRPRLFEVIQKVNTLNTERLKKIRGKNFNGSSYNANELNEHPDLEISYIIAPPRMEHYMKQSAAIYQIYLKYVAPEDIHVYSIDEVFMDITAYLETAGLSAREFTMKIILDILKTTGITATAGIGSNLYLCKVAMDIWAKHTLPDKNGVRIAELDEMSYRRLLWDHRPLTDFWRVGRGYAKKLEQYNLYTMGDIARCSIGKDSDYCNEELLYKLFGVNAELLIDHAWGWEPCTMADIKAYRPESNSIGSGQVLHCPYTTNKARLVVMEMADALSLDLVDKGLATKQIVMTIGYDIENLSATREKRNYYVEVKVDRYGRKVPKHSHGTQNLEQYTSSTKKIMKAAGQLYDRIVNADFLVRRIYLTAEHVIPEESVPKKQLEQLDLFTNYAEKVEQENQEKAESEKEKKIQQAVLSIKKKYGKNAVLKGMNLEEGATAKERNNQIGGHKA